MQSSNKVLGGNRGEAVNEESESSTFALRELDDGDWQTVPSRWVVGTTVRAFE